MQRMDGELPMLSHCTLAGLHAAHFCPLHLDQRLDIQRSGRYMRNQAQLPNSADIAMAQSTWCSKMHEDPFQMVLRLCHPVHLDRTSLLALNGKATKYARSALRFF